MKILSVVMLNEDRTETAGVTGCKEKIDYVLR